WHGGVGAERRAAAPSLTGAGRARQVGPRKREAAAPPVPPLRCDWCLPIATTCPVIREASVLAARPLRLRPLPLLARVRPRVAPGPLDGPPGWDGLCGHNQAPQAPPRSEVRLSGPRSRCLSV